MNNLNVNNLNTMAQKMIAITIGSKSILEDVMEVIHQKVNMKRHVQTMNSTIKKHKKKNYIGRKRRLALM